MHICMLGNLCVFFILSVAILFVTDPVTKKWTEVSELMALLVLELVQLVFERLKKLSQLFFSNFEIPPG